MTGQGEGEGRVDWAGEGRGAGHRGMPVASGVRRHRRHRWQPHRRGRQQQQQQRPCLLTESSGHLFLRDTCTSMVEGCMQLVSVQLSVYGGRLVPSGLNTQLAPSTHAHGVFFLSSFFTCPCVRQMPHASRGQSVQQLPERAFPSCRSCSITRIPPPCSLASCLTAVRKPCGLKKPLIQKLLGRPQFSQRCSCSCRASRPANQLPLPLASQLQWRKQTWSDRCQEGRRREAAPEG